MPRRSPKVLAGNSTLAAEPRQRRRGARRPPKSDSTIAIIDRLLLAPRRIHLDGEDTQVSTIELIVLSLVQKQLAGDERARRVLLKYQEFANRGIRQKSEIRFSENDYTRSFKVDEPGDTNG